jgi:hypothetical protein
MGSEEILAKIEASLSNTVTYQEGFNLAFEYKEGKLYWKITILPQVFAGYRAGCEGARYRYVGLCGKIFLEHRIIFTMFNGHPVNEVDHINRNKRDNRKENLRAATRRENSINQGLSSKNTSGIKGVSYSQRDKKWRAQITINGILNHLGSFNTKEAAGRAYAKKFSETYNEFAPKGLV